jgi:hypothetical protein
LWCAGYPFVIVPDSHRSDEGRAQKPRVHDYNKRRPGELYYKGIPERETVESGSYRNTATTSASEVISLGVRQHF